MPLRIAPSHPSLLIRRPSFERSGLTRAQVDDKLKLTADEFRVEGDLIVVGPVHDDVALGEFLDDLERLGLVYFEDYFDLSGNWPEWLTVFVRVSVE